MGRSFHWLLIVSMAVSLGPLAASAAEGANPAPVKKAPEPGKKDLLVEAWDEWDQLLKKYVDPKNGRVAYQTIDYQELEQHIDRYSRLNPELWNDDRRKAAYINFYNAGMILNILKYAKDKKIGLDSKEFVALEINDIEVPGGNIWNGNYKFKFAGEDLNLDNIEHDLIRGQASGKLAKLKVKKLDPRIHAAVNCAASSCPRVREKAYREDNVDAMLEENIKAWLASPSQFKKIDDDKLKANQIIYWYYDDFDSYGKQLSGKKGAGDYLAAYTDPKKNDGAWMAKHLQENFNDRSQFALKLSSSFDFFYNWQINDQRNQ